MRAVIYARYSSEQQREASIEDQLRQQRLLAEARTDAFDVVVAEALDRLSRDQEDVAALSKSRGGTVSAPSPRPSRRASVRAA